ncbi:hypothetical protein BDW66DRAFT_139252 [Aspergillus desertorum]
MVWSSSTVIFLSCSSNLAMQGLRRSPKGLSSSVQRPLPGEEPKSVVGVSPRRRILEPFAFETDDMKTGMRRDMFFTSVKVVAAGNQERSTMLIGPCGILRDTSMGTLIHPSNLSLHGQPVKISRG